MDSHVALTLDRLESRRLLSAAAHLGHGLLTVVGSRTYPNTIDVHYSSDHSSIDVSVNFVDRRGNPNNFSDSFPTSDGITSIVILGGRQSDTINVGQTGPTFDIPTLINAGSGNDSVTTGSENDTINGGGGRDVINAGDGNNLVRGGGSYDSITTGSGDDKIDGGPGYDTISAGGGNDVIVGGSGSDSIDAGAGNDSVWGGSGHDTLFGGAGDDVLWGGFGREYISGGDGNDILGSVKSNATLIGGAGQDTFIVSSLAKDPNNDYNAATDILISAKGHHNQGQHQPKI